MQKLSKRSITDALLYCYNGFNRTVGIAFSTHEMRNAFAQELNRELRESGLPGVVETEGFNLLFDTKSSIRLFSVAAPTDISNLKFSMIVYDHGIKGRALTRLKACEVPPDKTLPSPPKAYRDTQTESNNLYGGDGGSGGGPKPKRIQNRIPIMRGN